MSVGNDCLRQVLLTALIAVVAGVACASGRRLPLDAEAKWIGRAGLEAPAYGRVFTVRGAVRSARLEIAGLGFFEAWLNGRKVGDRVLEPCFTDYSRHVLYSTHELTGLVRGENRLKVLLCDGWYNVRRDGLTGFDRAAWRGFPRLIARLTVDYADGRSETILTDGRWTEEPNPVRFADMRVSGETVDGRLEGAETRADARHAEIASAPAGRLMPSDLPPSRVMRTLKPSAVIAVNGATNAWNVAFPENMAGWVRLTVRGAKRGDVVTVRYDERAQIDLQPAVEDARADRNPEDNTWRRQPRKIAAHAQMPTDMPPGLPPLAFQQDTYICRGDAVETFEPRFTYKGFQYALVTGLRTAPRRDDVTACVVHTDFRTIGRFACSDATLNALVAAADRSYRSNFVNGVPTDCPHREKNGWTGDASVASEQAQFVYENTDAYVKWIRDVCDAQRPNGEVMQIAPFGQAWGRDGQWNGPTWDSALAVIPWNLYLYRGDTRAMTNAVPAILRYSDFMQAHVRADGLVERGLGDWITPKTKTPLAFLASCHLMQVDELGARMAAMLGDANGATRLRARADALRAALVRTYRGEKGVWANGSQTAQSSALAFGLAAGEAERTATFARLVDACERADRTIDCGQLGLKTVFRELARGGRLDLAVDMLTNPRQPSMAVWLARGATTLWEDWWDGSSRNHVNYSDFVAVLYEHLAGIRLRETDGSVAAMREVTAPGFAEVTIAPQPVPGIDCAEASVNLPQGPLAVAWQIVDGRFSMILDIPSGVRARVMLPNGETRELKEGHYTL